MLKKQRQFKLPQLYAGRPEGANRPLPTAVRLLQDAAAWKNAANGTTLLTDAFEFVRKDAMNWRKKDGKAKVAGVLLIDEADSLAQSRELDQMHHEDRVGVNAVIRGIDSLKRDNVPVITVMCTNRIEAIDPAVRRRAAREFVFDRPTHEQRRAVIAAAVEGAEFTDEEIEALAEATGKADGRLYGYTYSDLRERLLPSLVLDAYPDQALSAERGLEIAKATEPTPPFSSEVSKEEV